MGGDAAGMCFKVNIMSLGEEERLVSSTWYLFMLLDETKLFIIMKKTQ